MQYLQNYRHITNTSTFQQAGEVKPYLSVLGLVLNLLLLGITRRLLLLNLC